MLLDFGYTQKLELHDPQTHQANPSQSHPFHWLNNQLTFSLSHYSTFIHASSMIVVETSCSLSSKPPYTRKSFSTMMHSHLMHSHLYWLPPSIVFHCDTLIFNCLQLVFNWSLTGLFVTSMVTGHPLLIEPRINFKCFKLNGIHLHNNINQHSYTCIFPNRIISKISILCNFNYIITSLISILCNFNYNRIMPPFFYNYNAYYIAYTTSTIHILSIFLL